MVYINKEKKNIDFIQFYNETNKTIKKDVYNIKTNLSKLINFESEIQDRLIGQDEAIKKVSGSIKRATIGLNVKKKPIGSFIFCGPTGVGKTEMAKTLSKNLYGNTKSLIRYDMSEYMEKHTVSKLIGTAPGYIGYGRDGLLTKQIKENPKSVILFDEIEKADLQIMDLFLQVLDEGVLKDSKGNIIDFTETIIILTSNLGSNFIFNFVKNKNILTLQDKNFLNKKILDLLLKKFRPEFINRLDDVIIFQPLIRETIYIIFEKQLEEKKRLIENKLKIKLFISPEVEMFLKLKSFNFSFGARQVSRTLQQYLENPLIDFLAKNRGYNDIIKNIKLDLNNEKLFFYFL